jgi:cellulose synthase/poly-beta-1,6-N-acetylglucosamine synthase-like glycosyltransferase
MTDTSLRLLADVFQVAFLGYFFAANTIYLVFTAIAWVELRRYRRRWTGDLEAVVRSPATPAISLVVPAFNEAATIVGSVRALLTLNYPRYEVVVVNDGSRDETLQVTVDGFHLAATEVALEQPLQTAAVTAVYRSVIHPDLTLIDKINGGKADAINAGINAARHPLVCVIDADSLLEPDALTRAVLPFLEDPTTIAAGGIVRVANGCRVEDGRITSVALPGSLIGRLQVAEYLRAFLAGRMAQSAMNALLLVSGAFGVFRRDAFIRVGGFDPGCIGEDMEVVVRMHRLYRRERRPYRIVFRPDPVCWTQAPEDRRSLAGQRNRWQRGALQTLSWHRAMLFNPRYGVVGMLVMPYCLVFEVCAPVIETLGLGVAIAAFAAGSLDWRFAEMLFLLAVCYGSIISLAAVLLEELSFRRYPRVRDLLALAACSIIENFGYRQINMWWRLRGMFDYARGKSGWGFMTRQEFGRT